MSSAPDQALAPAAQLDASGRSFVAFARWASALVVVMLSHLRGVMLIGWGDLPPGLHNPLVAGFYFATSFYHEAVFVFFVLSGFLIAGPNLDRVRILSFSPKSYAIDRFTRIYVTAFPALLLTIAADALGRHFLPGAGYYDGTNLLLTDRVVGGVQGDSFLGFIRNVFMLQPAHAPMLGSNVPLWSLSYEVWFYVWFGVCAFALQAKRRSATLWIALASIGLLLFHWTAIFYVAIWCFGALAYQRSRWPRSIILALIAVVLSLILSRADFVAGSIPGIPLKWSDLPLGLAFAWTLALMKRRSYRIWNGTEQFNQALSNFSYSLYVIHYPLLLCFVSLYATLGHVAQIKQGLLPNAIGLAIYLLVAVSTFLSAFIFSRIFEARTGAARRWLKARV